MKTMSAIAVITASAYVGLAIIIGSSYGVYWQAMDPVLFMVDFTEKFPLFLPGAFVTILPATIFSLVLFLRNKTDKPAREAWGIAFAAMALINAITLVYHVPVNFGFMDQSYTAAEATQKLNWWLILHWLRIGLGVLAAIYATRGFQHVLLGSQSRAAAAN